MNEGTRDRERGGKECKDEEKNRIEGKMMTIEILQMRRGSRVGRSRD